MERIMSYSMPKLKSYFLGHVVYLNQKNIDIIYGNQKSTDYYSRSRSRILSRSIALRSRHIRYCESEQRNERSGSQFRQRDNGDE
jgi:hypothetical protein